MLYKVITSAELTELDALWQIDPWGEERDDLRTGLICSTVAGSVGVTRKPSDFMLYADKAAVTQELGIKAMKNEWDRAVALWPGNK